MDLEGASVTQELPPTGDQCDVQSFLDEYGLEYTPDGQFIRWSCLNKKHPRNWPASRKIYDTGLIIFLDLFTYVRVSGASLQTLVFNPHSARLATRLTRDEHLGHLLALLG